VFLVFAGCAGSPDPAPETDAEETAPAEAEPVEAEPVEAEPSAAEQEPPPPEDSDPAPLLSETAPSLDLRPNQGSFSPELSDTLSFRWSTTDSNAAEAAADAVENWEFSLVSEAGDATLIEDGPGAPPQDLSWNGTFGNNGTVPPDGRYTPLLELTFTDGSTRSTEGRPFLIDTSAPIPSIALSGVPFRPGSSRGGGELIVTIDAEDESPIVAWVFEPRTLDGETLTTFSGASDVPRTARWNGRSGGSVAVESGEEYVVYGWVRDDAGNEASTETEFLVGAITEEYRGRDRIVLPRIEFPANSSDIADASAEALRAFETTVTRVARILTNAPNMEVLIEGHANSTRFSSPEAAEEEQQSELIPLSQARAEVVRQALIDRGIDGDRLQTVGVGAADPLTAFTNRDALDRNRRIELYVQE